MYLYLFIYYFVGTGIDMVVGQMGGGRYALLLYFTPEGGSHIIDNQLLIKFDGCFFSPSESLLVLAELWVSLGALLCTV